MTRAPEKKPTPTAAEKSLRELFQLFSFSDLFGVGHSSREGDNSPEDPALIEYAKVISRAKERVEIRSNELPASMYLSTVLQEALKIALKNGAIVEILVGEKADSAVLKQMILNGAIVRGLKDVDLREKGEITVIDMKTSRYKHPEKGYSLKYDQTIMRFVEGSEQNSSKFRELFNTGIPITADNLATWQNGLLAKKEAEKSGKIEVTRYPENCPRCGGAVKVDKMNHGWGSVIECVHCGVGVYPLETKKETQVEEK